MSGDGANLSAGTDVLDGQCCWWREHAQAMFRGSTCVQCVPLMMTDVKGSTLIPLLQLEKGRPKYLVHTMRLKRGLRVVGTLKLARGG